MRTLFWLQSNSTRSGFLPISEPVELVADRRSRPCDGDLHRAAAATAGSGWKAAVYGEIQNQRDGAAALTVRRMCALAKVSRAGFYRFPLARRSGAAEVELRDALQRIALEFPSYGWAIGLPNSSSNRSRRQVRPNLEAQRWSFLRTKRTTKRLLKDCWGSGLKCRPLP
jgi:hypothetical protein